MTREFKHFKLRLKYDSFARVESGEKKYEVRLYRGNVLQMRLGDKISFQNYGEKAPLERKIVALIIVPTFRELFDLVGPEDLGHSPEMGYSDWSNRIYQIYSPEQEKQYGVAGIKIAPTSSFFQAQLWPM